MLLAVGWAAGKGVEVPRLQVLLYSGLLLALAWCFLGIGMLISPLACSTDVVQGSAIIVWLVLLLFLDLILLGVMIKEGGLPIRCWRFQSPIRSRCFEPPQ